jgi:ribonuclease HIII
MEARKMIRSFSQVSAFQKQIIELNRPSNQTGYMWRKKADGTNHLYCDGVIVGQTKSVNELYEMVRSHAQRKMDWFKPDLLNHYFLNVDGLWRLYINNRFSKKSLDKKELKTYIEVVSWFSASGRAKSWGAK